MMGYLKGIVFFAIVFVVACSGGGGGEDNSTYSVSGSIEIQSNINTDSDNNDPFSSFSDNSDFATAQRINNIVVINGYVTRTPTGVQGDRFSSVIDRYDYYRVSLQEGQVVRLSITDFNEGTNDLDLTLFDFSQNSVVTSVSTTNFEEVSVGTDGEYYIRVEAFNGASKYVLSLGNNVSTTNAKNNRNIHLEDIIPNQAIVQYKPSVSLNSFDASVQSLAIDRPVLEDFTSSVSLNRLNHISKVLVPASADPALKSMDYDSSQNMQTLEKIKILAASGQVEYVSPNFMRHIQRVPNDPFYSQQWHYPLINLPQAWEVTTGAPTGDDVIVAVVDSGIYSEHEDLDDQLVTGYDFILSPVNARDGDGIDPNPEDPGDSTIQGESSWHGTHVSGTVAAESDNGTGVAGVSWGAKIMPLRVCGSLGCSTYDIMQAVRYAAGLSNDSGTLPSQPASIINLSLGGFGSSSAEAQLFQQLYDSGIIVVAAAGNEGTSQLSYPASYPGVFSVSAVDAEANLSYYSNFGSAIDIAAPGGDISVDTTGDGNDDGVKSTLVDDSLGATDLQSSYAFYQGTSMAAPHVAGMFALMKAVYPDLTATQVNVYLMQGDLTVNGDNERDDSFGYGLADAFAAVSVANDLAGGAPLPEIVVATPSQLSLGAGASGTITLESIGGGLPAFDSSTQSAWINPLAPVNVDAQGLGEYQITVDRSDLLDGYYTGSVVLNFDTASSVSINVNMTVGDISEEGSTSNLYGLLLNADDFVSEYAFTTTAASDGFSYSVSNVQPGDYYILVSTDIENDYILCQSGEACGIYPLTSSIEAVTVDSNISNADLTVGILSNASLSSLSNVENVNTVLQSLLSGKGLPLDESIKKSLTHNE